MILLLAVIGQVFIEAKDIGRPILGVRPYLPTSWTTPLRKVPVTSEKSIKDLLSDVNAHHTQPLVIRHDETGEIDAHGLPPVHVGVHDEETHGPATSWENLDPKDQHLWKERLKKAGHWAEGMGESIFQGVLFGEIGGAIGNIVGEAL